MGFIINPFFSSPFFPSDVSGLIRWYKADSYSLADGSTIGQAGREWIDQSVSAQNATADLSSEPIYHTNVFGTMPAIQFTTAGSQFLRVPTLLLSGEFTIIAVGSSTSDNAVFGSEIDNSETRIGNGGNRLSQTIDISGSGSDFFSGAQNTVRMMTWRRSSGLIYFREQNIARGSATNASISSLITYTLINFNSGALIGNTIIGEICVYSQGVSDANLDSLYTRYFKTRWGLP